MKEPNHEIFRCRDGSWTLKDLRTGQAMHSEIGPWREAREIFIQPSRLRERALRPGAPLVIYDLGLGIAANALAALDEWRKVPNPKRGLRLISYEIDPSSLAQAMESGPSFLDPYRSEAETLLRSGRWESDAGEPGAVWELITGNFVDRMVGTPELVFFDLYCPKTQPDLWAKPVFERLRAAMAPDGVLLTYSAAGHVRRALAEAGFHVGSGPGTELKRESTHASLCLQELAEPIRKRYHFSNESEREAASTRSVPFGDLVARRD